MSVHFRHFYDKRKDAVSSCVRLTARAKMSLSRAQNIFMSANINSIVLLHIFIEPP